MRKKTKEQFIEYARRVHGDLYDYSKVHYINSTTKVCIIDPDYGEFWQQPNNHLMGKGNKYRAGNVLKTTEQFVQDARKVHSETYDYSKTNYVNAKTEVCIIDPDYGEFWVSPNKHLGGQGHIQRSHDNRIKKLSSNTEEFIEKARLKHGNRYDYSKVEYVNSSTDICIIDPDYGEFMQNPDKHLAGANHPKRAIDINRKKASLTKEEFIKRATDIHNDLYDYSKVKYVNSNTNVCIIDPKYGEFWQQPNNHLMGKGSFKRGRVVAGKAKMLTTDEFIRRAREVHGDLYDYSQAKYLGMETKLCIIDPDYGEFWQQPNNHLSGNGHPSRAVGGFDPNKEAILYYISINAGTAYKIGITNRTLDKRFGKEEMEKVKVIKTWYYPLGIDAYDEEQRILREFQDAKYEGPDLLSSVRTKEMFKYDILGLDQNTR